MTEIEDKLSKCLVDDEDRLHERRLRTMKAAFAQTEKFEDIARDYGLDEHTVAQDWSRRASWLPQFLLLDDAQALQSDIIGKWTIYLDLCMNLAQLYRLDNKAASNNSLKLYKEGLAEYATLLQSMGMVPKVALEQAITVKKTTADDDTGAYILEHATAEEREIMERAFHIECDLRNKHDSVGKLH